MLIFRYVIVYQKGYQSEDIGLSAVTTKLKGTVLTNLSIDLPVRVNNRTIKSTVYDGPRIWDSSDYVIPPEVMMIWNTRNELFENIMKTEPTVTKKFNLFDQVCSYECCSSRWGWGQKESRAQSLE